MSTNSNKVEVTNTKVPVRRQVTTGDFHEDNRSGQISTLTEKDALDVTTLCGRDISPHGEITASGPVSPRITGHGWVWAVKGPYAEAGVAARPTKYVKQM